MRKFLKNKAIKAMLLIGVFLFAVSLTTITKVYAEAPLNKDNGKTATNYEKYYNQGVREKLIDPKTITLEEWIDDNIRYKKVYDDGIAQGVLESNLDYGEWLKSNRYGQPPIVDSSKYEEIKLDPIMMMNVEGFDFLPGDILITDGTDVVGLLGHAAIATGYDYILDIPGLGETTRQTSPLWWTNHYRDEGWVRVYRLRDRSLATAAARWADRNYYSSSGSSTQNIFPEYSITPYIYSLNPTYCSKIVYQAYYYGTGSAPVMKALQGFIHPLYLIDAFNPDYTPDLAKTYVER